MDVITCHGSTYIWIYVTVAVKVVTDRPVYRSANENGAMITDRHTWVCRVVEGFASWIGIQVQGPRSASTYMDMMGF